MLELSWLQRTPPIVIASILFFLLILFYIVGYRLRVSNLRKRGDNTKEDLGAINGTLLGLLALLLAFTFGMANSRYDARRQSIVEEVNAISTVILRTDIYPDSMRNLLRQHLKHYVEARIDFYEVGMDVDKLVSTFLKASDISQTIWTIAADYARKDNITTRTSELIPALNTMMDITTTRRAVGESTIPDSILYFLFILCFTSAFLLGYDVKNRFDWVVVIGFALMLSATVYTIIDLDRPRMGLITVDSPNRKMIELLEMFKE